MFGGVTGGIGVTREVMFVGKPDLRVMPRYYVVFILLLLNSFRLAYCTTRAALLVPEPRPKGMHTYYPPPRYAMSRNSLYDRFLMKCGRPGKSSGALELDDIQLIARSEKRNKLKAWNAWQGGQF